MILGLHVALPLWYGSPKVDGRVLSLPGIIPLNPHLSGFTLWDLPARLSARARTCPVASARALAERCVCSSCVHGRRVLNFHAVPQAPHHMSHAVLGFYDSPFSNAIIVTLDGRAEESTGLNVYVADRRTGLRRFFQAEARS